MEATLEIADYAASLRFADLPPVVVDRAKVAVLDTLGVTLAGSAHRVIDLVGEFVADQARTGPATVIGRGRALSTVAAAFVNGCSAHVLDFDDSGHASAHLVPTSLALAEQTGLSGAEFLTSYVAGREVRMRLNEEIDTGRFDLGGAGPGSRGWHAAGTLGALGSAVAGGRVLTLEPERMAMAIGMAASLASGVMANFGTMTKCIHVGNAARNGVLAASLVGRGVTADPSVLTKRHGFVQAMCLPGECDLDKVVDGLRGGFLLEQGNRIKPYPSCSGTHRFIEGTRALLAEHPLDPEDIEAIWCTTRASLVCPEPRDDLECKFSAPFAIAATIIDGSITQANCTAEFLARPDVQGLMSRTTQIEQEEVDRILIRTRDGSEFEHTVLPPPSLTAYADVAAKFHACADPIVGPEGARAIEEAVGRLEELDDVRVLSEHLVGRAK